MKTAIITGVTGQLGSYLTEYLLEKGLRVIGTARRLSVPNHGNISHIKDSNFKIELVDLGDHHSIETLIEKYKPDYFINCAANSFVGTSWKCPEQHFEYNALGVLRQLETIRKISPSTRYINLGSSEEFGDVITVPQDETHPPRARSPYGASKVAAHQIVKVWRESYNLYAVQCICFNYESPRRGHEFITRKITRNAARIVHEIKTGQNVTPMELGNVNAQRDWSHVLDICEGIWRMLNQEKYNKDLSWVGEFDGAETMRFDLSKNIKEYVFSSGETHAVKEFVEKAFAVVGIEGYWIGEGVNQQFVHKENDPLHPNRILVNINKEFYRPAEVNLLLGCSDLAKKELGWMPKIGFNALIKEMMQRDLAEYNIVLD